MSQHVWFVCRQCGRYITGCLLSCPLEHRVEEVDNCVMCAKKQESK